MNPRLQAFLPRAGAFALIALLGLTPVTRVRGAASDVDLTFDPGSTCDGGVSALLLPGDGKVIIGGDFTTLHGLVRNRLARLNADGRADPAFLAEVARPDGYAYVQCLAGQPDGKILVGGWFTAINGVARTNLARLNPDGSVDPAFLAGAAGVDGSVSLLLVQPDGRILVGGWYSAVNGVARTNLARLNPNGSLDESFVVALKDELENAEPAPGNAACLVLQADGRILVGGAFTSVNGTAWTNLARLQSDGALDTSFVARLQYENDEGVQRGYPECLALQPDGRILVGGSFTSVNGLNRTNLARLETSGAFDASFFCPLGHPDGDVVQLVLRADGRLVARGYLNTGEEQWRVLALLEANGSPAPTYADAFPEGGVQTIALQPDNRLVVGGTFWQAGGALRRSVARLQPDLSLDAAFDNGGPTGPDNSVDLLALQPDGQVLIGGQSLFRVNGQLHNGIARLRTDGSLDESFAAQVGGGYPYNRGLALQGDGKILLAGQFSEVEGQPRHGIARLNADGSLDRGFLEGLAGVEQPAVTIAAQTNGYIIVGGLFDSVNGVPRTGLARLNPDGTLAEGMTNEPWNGPVSRVLVQADGKVLAAGSSALLRFNSDGSRDTGFAGWGIGNVSALALQPDGRILVAGSFSIIQNQYRTGLARLNANGTLDNSFLDGVAGPDGSVNQVAVDADGKILLSGGFNAVNGVSRAGFARLLPDGSLDATFQLDLHNRGITALVVQPDSRILLGGWFTAVNDSARAGVARLLGACVVPAFSATPSSRTAEAGYTVSLTALATGSPAVTYQWFLNGDALPGGTNRTLRLEDVQADRIGDYTVVAANMVGAVTSAPARLNVIAPVARRAVPGLLLSGPPGSVLTLRTAETLEPSPAWAPLATVTLGSPPQYYFDLTEPLPPTRFYRAWQTSPPGPNPPLDLRLIPALTLTGELGATVRVETIQAVGPTDAWLPLDTVTLTNTTQLYFDIFTPAVGTWLYRLIPQP